ncbi:unnamed protein product [Microthlaspi erraticum]|uniref:RRM domain-containing protein n=1 Tax=Microthlaspi erraticum TaxID=1685480 RepID=A0A6D2JTH9_9BRAS|nr:unnamed protein product [Microthlaspi erraticum]
MQLNESGERDERSSKRVLVVAKGFDVSVPEGCTLRKRVLRLESKLRDHFSSCGKIKSVCIPHAYHSCTIKRYAYIDIWGIDAEEKALQLNGTEMDGHKLVVTPPLRPMKRARRRALKNDRSARSDTMIVEGYDTSVPRKIMKSALHKHFSSCGEVLEVDLYPNLNAPDSDLKFVASSSTSSYAYVDIYGEGAEEKALQLSGSDMGGFKLVVEEAFRPKPPEAGGRSPLREVWLPSSYSEYMASMNKSQENQEDSKQTMQLNERDGRSRKRVVVVAKGYDVSVPEGCTLRERVLRVESMLRDHFSSCGKIKSVCIPHASYGSTLKRHAYIDIWGIDAEEKALQLNGTEMDGHKLVVTPPLRPMKRARLRALKTGRYCRSEAMIVKGYDTSFPRKMMKIALVKHFSSCGEVLDVDFPNKNFPISDPKYACVFIYGEGAKEKALQLSGSDMGGCKLVVEEAFCPKLGDRDPCPDSPWTFLGRDTCPGSDWTSSCSEYKDPNTNKRKENPDPNSENEKKRQKTSN